MYGGSPTYGTVFSVPLTGDTPTILATFNGPNGSNPHGGLTLSGSTLYGTEATGGPTYSLGYANGGVFSVPMTGGTDTILASFNGTDGSRPYSSLIRIDTTLYGTTYIGGTDGCGTVFSATPVSRMGGKVITSQTPSASKQSPQK